MSAGFAGRPGDAALIVARHDVAILWANAAARAVLGSLDHASNELFAASPASRAFATRLGTMVPGSAPRLERIRFGRGPFASPQIVSCSIVDEHGFEPLAVLRWALSNPDQEPAGSAGRKQSPASPDPSMAGGPDSFVDMPASEVRRARRVLWIADRRGIVTHVDPDFARIAGAGALAVGDHLPTRLAAIDPGLGDDVDRVLVHGGAFLTSRRNWPQAAGAPLQVEIGCARRRGLSGGLGGFCVFHTSKDEPRALGSSTAESSGMPETEVAENAPRQALPDPTAVATRTTGETPPAPGASADPGSNVVHFPAMRIASVPAKFGVELRSAPAVPAPPAEPGPEPEHLVAPRWSEAPEPDRTAEGLSPDEQEAFAEIGQVLGTRPSAARGQDEDVERRPEQQHAPDVASLLESLPLPLVWQVGGTTGANAAFRQRAGFEDGPVPAGIVTRDPAGATAHLAGADGAAFEAQAITVEWQGGPASLFVVPQQAPIPDVAVTTVSDTGDLAPGIHALDIATNGHATVNDDGTIARVSLRGARLLGYEPADLLGRPVTDLAMAESRDEWQALLRAEDAEGSTHELIGRTRMGHPIPLLVRAGRIAANGFLIAWIDDGERQRAMNGLEASRREAERTSALKSEFLAKVSHEIRTPLNAILGFTEIIRDERLGPVGNDRYVDYLKDIHSSGAHVLSLVNDLLDLSRIEAGRMDLRLEAVDANAIVSTCVSALQTQAHRERVIVRLSLAPALPAALADERSLRQIVLNLLSNAVKFNEPGGQVIVSTALADQDTVAIRIRDTGIGMTEAEIETAMEPFRQVSAVKRTGSGLGLPVTKALVEANCAVMTIRSTPGQGTLVEVAFPVVEHNSMSLPAE